MIAKVLSRLLNEQESPLAIPYKLRVFEFFKENPRPTDAEFHQWAEESGIDVEKAEEAAYIMAGKLAELMSKGESGEKGVGINDVDREQLYMGIEVEKEHTPCSVIAAKIALDHLAEIPDYYTRLDKMEREAGVSHHEACAADAGDVHQPGRMPG